MGRHRTPEEKAAFREQAVALRRAGVGAKRIAQQLGIGGALVHELLRGEPVPSSLQRPRAKDELREAAVALRLDGRSYSEIRDELGVSKGSLSLWLRDLARPTEQQRAVLREPDGSPSDLPADGEIARQLRAEGWLLREIADELGVHATTVHAWCRGVPVPAQAVHGRPADEVPALRRAHWDACLAERDRERQALIGASAASVGALSERELELVAVTAYWCEGAKSKPWAKRERLVFINSDPNLICVWVRWLGAKGVSLDDCRICVSIHASADVGAATDFWARVLGVPADRFARPTLKRHNPTSVRKNTGASYVGCLVVATRASRLLYQELEGLWRGIVRGALAD